jgi:6-hydroxymethylpterin diphosphokinase MptE-like protein
MSQSALQINLDALATAGRAEVRDAAGAWIRLHSARDPRAEARRQGLDLASRAAGVETLVLIGGGVGYLPEALLEDHMPRVIVIEPSADLAQACLSRRDWSAWREAGRFELRVWPDVDEPYPLWQLFDRDEPEPFIAVQPVLARVAGELTERMRKQLARIVFEGRANADARRRQAGRYLINTLSNLAPIARSADAGALKDALKGRPAILVAAGPSLDAVLPSLADVSETVAIIAVDTALRPLLNAGIQPPLAVALDPTELNGTHLRDLPPHDSTWLVAEPSVAPAAVQAFQDRLLTFRVADHHPWPWLATQGIERHLVRVWGSVLTAALDLAIFAGADPIVFVGADLAYTEGRPYCRNATWERHWAEVTGRGAALEDLWRSDLAARPLETALDIHGRPAQTTAHLIAFRDWLIARMAAADDRRYVNATGAGLLYGASIVQSPLDEAIGVDGTRAALLRRLKALSEDADRASAGIRLRLASDFAAPARDTLHAWADFGKATMSRGELDAAIAQSRDLLLATAPLAAAMTPRLAGALPAADRVARLHAALHGSASPSGEDTLDPATAQLVDLCRHLSDHQALCVPRPELPVEGGRVPVSLLTAGPAALLHEIERFEDSLAAGLIVGHRAKGREPFTLSSLHRPAALPILLAHQWLCVAAAYGETSVVNSPDAVRWVLEGAVASGAEHPARRPSPEALVEVVVGEQVPLQLTIDPSALMARVTGLVGIVAPRMTTQAMPVRMRLTADGQREPSLAVLGLPLLRLEPQRLTPPAIGPAGNATTVDARRALIVPTDATASILVNEDGEVQPSTAWPRAIWGELPTAGRGAYAWHNPDRALLYRESDCGSVTVVDVAFRPVRGVVLPDGASLWCAYDGGLWRWQPGALPQQVAHTETPIHVSLDGTRVRIDPATRRLDGAAVRRRMSHAWHWQPDTGALSTVRLDADAQCTSREQQGGWTASVHPYADVVTIAGPGGIAARLAVDYPLTAAWAGRSLVVCTGDRAMLFFHRFTDRLTEALR